MDISLNRGRRTALIAPVTPTDEWMTDSDRRSHFSNRQYKPTPRSEDALSGMTSSPLAAPTLASAKFSRRFRIALIDHVCLASANTTISPRARCTPTDSAAAFPTDEGRTMTVAVSHACATTAVSSVEPSDTTISSPPGPQDAS